ncbi:MAG: hypothetical protein ACFFDY_12865 [Candidatus Thorarchaeota archaeon]
MKKISYTLRIGIIGKKKTIEPVFFERLKITAIKSKISDEDYEFLVVFKQIPIKIKIFIAEKIEELIFNFNKIKKLDVIILPINLNEPASLQTITKQLVDEFNELFSFQGLSILVGVDFENIFNRSTSAKFRISRYQLEKITKDLNLIYCFEIINNNSDINEIYNTIFTEFMIRFQYSNPELFDVAKDYGKKLLS